LSEEIGLNGKKVFDVFEDNGFRMEKKLTHPDAFREMFAPFLV
jgi:hypothetical protein